MDDAEFADVSVSAESARSAWKIGFPKIRNCMISLLN